MPQSRYELYYHLVWSTLNRLPFIDPDLKHVVSGLITTKGTALGCRVLTANCVEDHVHVILWIPATMAVATVANHIKGFSSHEIRSRYCRDFRWQEGYAAYTVRRSDLCGLREYVKKQEERHRHKW